MLRRLLKISASCALVCAALLALQLGLRDNLAVPAASASREPRRGSVVLLCVQPANVSCFGSIGAALNAAHDGDTIEVAGGTYIEYVVITKTVTLEGGWNSTFTARNLDLFTTIIRPPDATFSVVHIQGPFGNSAAFTPTLDGFTITGGGGGNHGGGIRVTNSDAVISHNIITGNLSYLLGGGIWVQNGAPLIENNYIENNQINSVGSAGWGGGIDLENTQATLIGNVIGSNAIGNSVGFGGGIAIQGGGPVTLSANT